MRSAFAGCGGHGAGSHAAAAPSTGERSVTLSAASAPGRADLAPEQHEDSLPRPVLDDRPMSRADTVGEALSGWVAEATGTESGPSFLTRMRDGENVLDLTHSHPSGLAQLLAGRGPTRLSSLVREAGALGEARARARALRETAERQAEEIGVMTCHLGIGEAQWEPLDGSAPVQAPVLVRPLTLRLRGSAREDVELEIDASVDINPVLLRALRDAGVAVDARALLSTTEGTYGFDPNPVLDAFRALGEPLPGFRVSHALVVGNMMDAVGPLVDDLHADRADWVNHPLVAALAGDADARRAAGGSDGGAAGASDLPEPDERDLVAAVDPDHEEALAQVLRGRHLSIASQPGVDTMGLVVDLMAELNARGRTVLVVSPRMRNLAQIIELARERGLADLLFDLSPDPALQRNASEALLRSLRGAGSFTAPPSTLDANELERLRETLTGHVEAMHRVQRPWGVSAHDAMDALAALTRLRPAPRTTVRLPADVAARMVGSQREAFADLLREAAESGALTATAEDSAWFGAAVSTRTQADHARSLVTRMRDSLLDRLRDTAHGVGPEIGLKEPASLAGVDDRLGLLRRIRATLRTMEPGVFDADLDSLLAATADSEWRSEHGIALGWGARRRLRTEAAALMRGDSRRRPLKETHDAIAEARRLRTAWTAQRATGDEAPAGVGAVPTLPDDLPALEESADAVRRACDELAVLLDGTPAGGSLATSPIEALSDRIELLHDDLGALETLPRQRTILDRLEFEGLGGLVEDLRERRVPAEQTSAELELAWWRSVLELIAGAEPTISSNDGWALSEAASTFRELDAQEIAESSSRVREVSDRELVSTMKTFPETSRSAIAELARAATTSVRDLAGKYEDILFRARPAWLASPFVVPQIVPRGRRFDVVIVADGGRLPTWAALPSIIRGSQTVVVGDPFEYSGDEGRSLLDDMQEVAPTVRLRRDPMPATGGLRAFAQRRTGGDPTIAVPSPTPAEPDRLVIVDDARGHVDEALGRVESTEAELRRVTDAVIEHARTRPERSLAVVTLTDSHAKAVMSRILHTVGVIPSLRDFFDPDLPEYFTVVPASQAASVLRDDVILSFGFGRTLHGRILHTFGPLSGPNGRKALMTALTRARGRTTVVSAFKADDLDLMRLRTEGTRDLYDLLTYLYTGIDPIDDGDAPVFDGAGGAASGGGNVEAGEQPSARGEAAARDAADDQRVADAPEDSDDLSEERGPVSDAGAPAESERPEEPETPSEAESQVDPEPKQGPGDHGVDPSGDDEEPGEEAGGETGGETVDALVADLADRLWRRGVVVSVDYGLTDDRIELALGHPELPGRYLVAVDTDGARYVDTASQRERDRLRAERLEAAGWWTERVWSWPLFIDPEEEAERIARAVDRAYAAFTEDSRPVTPRGAASPRHRLPHPQIPVGQDLSFYSSDDFDRVVAYLSSDGRERFDDQLAAEVREFLGFESRHVLLDVAVASAIRRYRDAQRRQELP